MTNLLTAAEIEQMQADFEDVALPDTCNILSVTRTYDGQGGYTDTWGTATASVACRLDYRTGFETLSGGAVQPYTGWYVTVPHDTSLTSANRVQVGTISYNVVDVDEGHSWELFLRARVEKV